MKRFIRTTLLLVLLAGLITFLKAQTSELNQDKYGGFTSVQGEATGYFHPEHIVERWWLITPEGSGVFGVGIER